MNSSRLLIYMLWINILLKIGAPKIRWFILPQMTSPIVGIDSDMMVGMWLILFSADLVELFATLIWLFRFDGTQHNATLQCIVPSKYKQKMLNTMWRISIYHIVLITLWLFNIAMENGP